MRLFSFLSFFWVVLSGQMLRKQIIPKFDDILQYVDYLNLDEPVIGTYHRVHFSALKLMCRKNRVLPFQV